MTALNARRVDPVSNVDPFVRHLDSIGVVLFTATPGIESEYTRPNGWQNLTADGNAERLTRARPGDAFCAVTGELVAVLDVDPRNGGDVGKVAGQLDGLGVRKFAQVATPGGGAHFYVAGHPDLPSASKLRKLPGVDVQSHGHNVFLPGTQRPKYDGAGYCVQFDDLDALADGGDPDGAEELAVWVAKARLASGADAHPVAPPWDGTPPDDRQRRYLAAALAAEVADVERGDGGRNNRLNSAAFSLGQLVAGAGLDETEVRDALEAAAQRCGYTADDGIRQVRATISSGLRAGLTKPRAIPPAPDRPFGRTASTSPPATTDDDSPAAVRSITRADAHGVFRRWLGPEYDLDALDVILAAAACERLPGDPLWLLLVSGSGAAKTETVQALGDLATITSTISSPGALLSATSRKERTKDSTGGLLRAIGDRGLLVIKDVTSILSMNAAVRAETLAALREVHDGRWSRNVGTDGGRTLEWTGRIVVVGAVTTAWDKAREVIATMGDRFVLLRIDSTTGRVAAGRQAIGNTGSETTMRTELSEAVAGVIAGIGTEAPDLDESLTEKLLSAADLVTLARTGVEYDYKGDVIDAHAPELPTRFAKQLAQIVRGCLVIGMTPADALRLAIRCARDSMPPLRLAIVEDLTGQPAERTTNAIRQRIGKPRSTVDRQLQALHMLGVIKCEEVEQYGADGKSTGRVWHYSLADDIEPAALRVKLADESTDKPVPDLSPHELLGSEKDVSEVANTHHASLLTNLVTPVSGSRTVAPAAAPGGPPNGHVRGCAECDRRKVFGSAPCPEHAAATPSAGRAS